MSEMTKNYPIVVSIYYSSLTVPLMFCIANFKQKTLTAHVVVRCATPTFWTRPHSKLWHIFSLSSQPTSNICRTPPHPIVTTDAHITSFGALYHNTIARIIVGAVQKHPVDQYHTVLYAHGPPSLNFNTWACSHLTSEATLNYYLYGTIEMILNYYYHWTFKMTPKYYPCGTSVMMLNFTSTSISHLSLRTLLEVASTSFYLFMAFPVCNNSKV